MDEPATETAPDTREPIINAPGVAVALALGLVAMHAVRLIAPEGAQVIAYLDGALIPERFWAEATSSVAYGSSFAAALTLVSHAGLHGGWGHVLMNAVMALAVGAPVARFFGSTAAGMLRFFAVFLGAVVAGGIAHLLSHMPAGPAAVGASGGVSGLMAAALVLTQGGRVMTRSFAVMAAAFTAANIALIWAGPAVFGAGIAWQAHVGGFFGGAALFAALRNRA